MVLKMEIILKMTPQSGLELPLVEPSYGNLQVQIWVEGTPKGLQTLHLSISDMNGAKKLAKEASRSQKTVKINSGYLTRKSKTAINPFKQKMPRWIRQQFEFTTNGPGKSNQKSNPRCGRTCFGPWRQIHDFLTLRPFFSNQWENQPTLRQSGLTVDLWQANGLKIFDFYQQLEILWVKTLKIAKIAVLGGN